MPFFGLCHGIGPSPAIISPLYENGHVGHYISKNPQADRLALVSRSNPVIQRDVNKLHHFLRFSA
jgi:hypothetical protein